MTIDPNKLYRLRDLDLHLLDGKDPTLFSLRRMAAGGVLKYAPVCGDCFVRGSWLLDSLEEVADWKLRRIKERKDRGTRPRIANPHDQTLHNLPLSVRAKKSLQRAYRRAGGDGSIKDIVLRDVIGSVRSDRLSIERNCGPSTIREIAMFMESHGIKWIPTEY